MTACLDGSLLHQFDTAPRRRHGIQSAFLAAKDELPLLPFGSSSMEQNHSGDGHHWEKDFAGMSQDTLDM